MRLYGFCKVQVLYFKLEAKRTETSRAYLKYNNLLKWS